MKKKLLIAYGAAKSIIKEVRKWSATSVRTDRITFVETGGPFVGTYGEQITIAGAGGSGENSLHYATQFTSDPDADKCCLAKIRQKHGDAIELVGVWHTHQPGNDKPSLGDCKQARQLQEDYNDGKPVLMGIVTQRPGLFRSKIMLRLYRLDADNNIVEVPWRLVGSRSKDLLEAIGTAPVRVETNKMGFWKEIDFQFYLNPVGRQRLQKEIRLLKDAGWQISTSRQKPDDVLILDLVRLSNRLRFIFPPEYPLNGPKILTPDDGRSVDTDMMDRWNSLCRLDHLAEEAAGVLAWQNNRNKLTPIRTF